jgi:alpha-L-fucosidase
MICSRRSVSVQLVAFVFIALVSSLAWRGGVRAEDASPSDATPGVTTPKAATVAECPEGFVPLLNGQDLDGWTGSTDGYKVVDGAIVCEGGGNLFTEKEYANFVLRFEFKLPPGGGNNGIGIRSPLTGDPAYVGMEIQVIDNTAKKYENLKPYQFHGSVYGVVPAKRGYLKPRGEWNQEEIYAYGSHIKVTLNGQVIVDADLTNEQPKDGRDHPGLSRASGHIGLLGHGAPVAFRNLCIKQLPALTVAGGVAAADGDVAAAAAAAAAAPTGVDPDDPGAPPAAIDAWKDLRFGMFIHWGPVALTGHEIGWSRGRQTPIEEYDNLYKKFNPTKFDAEEWAKTAKDAGMKYMVITTKHHDGFCLWPSEYTDYDIAETPFGRDVLKELSDACRKHGLKFGTYYSTCDWHHPDYPKGSPAGRTNKPNPNLPGYMEYLENQSQELVKKYGPLLTMWFDVPREVHKKDALPATLALRKLQPDIVINNRGYMEPSGDYDTPEQRIGGFNRERPWETCMTICRQWAWKPNDQMKSLNDCLKVLIYTIGGDGNLLFNVGPTAEGVIEQRQVERLKEMGDWVKQHAEAIYGTRGGPYKPGNWGASTCKKHFVYLFVMDWPEVGGITLPKLPAAVQEASLLNGDAVEVTTEGNLVTVNVPAEKRDEFVTVVRLKLNGGVLRLDPVAVPDASSGSVAVGKPATASNVFQNQQGKYGPAKALDDDAETRWATDAGTREAWLEVDLGEPVEVGRTRINEWYDHHPRVRSFEVQYRDGDDWKTAQAGGKIGTMATTTFSPIKARHWRLNILSASDGPTIKEFQLLPPK